MKARNGLIMARGQMAWILGLLVSTAIVVQLERLELGSRLAVLETNPLAQTDPASAQALRDARIPTLDPGSATPSQQAELLLALSLVALQPGANRDALEAEAVSVIDAIGVNADDDPLLRDAVTLAQRVFGL